MLGEPSHPVNEEIDNFHTKKTGSNSSLTSLQWLSDGNFSVGLNETEIQKKRENSKKIPAPNPKKRKTCPKSTAKKSEASNRQAFDKNRGNYDPSLFGGTRKLCWELIDAAVKQGTLKTYLEAVEEFVQFVALKRLVLDIFEMPAQKLDFLLFEFISILFRASGKNYFKAVYARVGLQHCNPRLVGELVLSARALKGWKKMKPSSSALPLPEGVVWVVWGQLMFLGADHRAMAFLMAFELLLRHKEVMNILTNDVIMGEKECFFRLRDTKTGPLETVQLVGLVLEIFKVFWREKESSRSMFLFDQLGDKLFDVQVEKIFEKFEVHKLGFTPHGLRHGGALKAHLGGDNDFVLKRKGRWRSVKTLRVYLQVDMLRVIERGFSEEQLRIFGLPLRDLPQFVNNCMSVYR